jgi:hypothetical protein
MARQAAHCRIWLLFQIKGRAGLRPAERQLVLASLRAAPGSFLYHAAAFGRSCAEYVA